MTLQSDTKFKEKLTRSFKYDTKNFVNYHQSLKSFKVLLQWAIFVQSIWSLSLKKYGRVIFHDTEQWYKIWINPDLVVSKMAWEIGWTFITALKNLKNCTLMGSYWPKDIMLQLENFRGIMCHDTEGYIMQNLKENWLVAWKMP